MFIGTLGIENCSPLLDGVMPITGTYLIDLPGAFDVKGRLCDEAIVVAFDLWFKLNPVCRVETDGDFHPAPISDAVQIRLSPKKVRRTPVQLARTGRRSSILVSN